VLGISGSLRAASLNTAALRAAAELAPPDMRLEIADLAGIPLYNADEEATGLPAAVQQLRAHIAAADALVIATPEYNYSMSAALKNAIDWVSRPPRPHPLDGKPLAILGAGGRLGTARAQMHLRQVANGLGMLVLPRPEVFIIRASEKFDAAGQLTDQATRDEISAMLVALAAWTRRLTSPRSAG
jgi:chromate reductase